MKKIFLVGIGLLLIGSATAARINHVSLSSKSKGGTVTSSEFNMMTDAIKI